MNKILVTGGTGLVGSHLLMLLVTKQIKCRAIKRKSSSLAQCDQVAAYYGISQALLGEYIEWVEADLLDKASLKQALHGIEEVYHCGAIVSFSADTKQQLLDTNVEGTRNITEASLEGGIKKFCMVSSIAAIGKATDGGSADETCMRDGAKGSVYSQSKFASEQVVWEAMNRGLNAVIVNPGIILGVGDFSKGSLQFFPAIKKGMLFYTNGGSGFVDVRDVCKVMVEAMDRELFAQRFVLVSANLTYGELFRLIADAEGVKPPRICAGKGLLTLALWSSNLMKLITGKEQRFTKETLQSASTRSCYSSAKVMQALNFRFISIEETICDAAAYFLEHSR